MTTRRSSYVTGEAMHSKPRPQVLEVFRSPTGWGWRFRASNGAELARASQVYTRRRDCLNSAASTVGLHPDAMTDGCTVDRATGVPVKVVILDERGADA